MRYDRARGSLDRHAAYIVAAYVAGAARSAASTGPFCLAARQPPGRALATSDRTGTRRSRTAISRHARTDSFCAHGDSVPMGILGIQIRWL